MIQSNNFVKQFFKYKTFDLDINVGNPAAVSNLEQRMNNCYADLDKIWKHHSCTFDYVVKEDNFTIDMAQMLEKSAYRVEVNKKEFPTDTWLEVKGLALPEFTLEIELEVHKSE